MTNPIPKFRDMTPTEAIASGYDIVQPKFDGNFAHLVVSNGRAEVYSKTGKLKAGFKSSLHDGVYLGEYIRNTNWATRQPALYEKVVLFDFVTPGTYLQRHAAMVKQGWDPRTPFLAWFWMQRQSIIWDKFVIKLGYEGVVFRKSDAPITEQLARHKNTKELTVYVTRVIEGTGKCSGMLGAFGYSKEPGGPEVGTVGSGLDDRLRRHYWHIQSTLPGLPFEIKGYPGFDGELPRHPVFLRFKS
jgi:hypothetical protein